MMYAHKRSALTASVSRSILTIGLSAAAIGYPAVARAQTGAEQTPHGLDEIVVTARKQAEPLMKVPVVAAMIDGSMLARTGATDPASLGSSIPSVSIQRTTGGAGTEMSIRGIGASGSDSGVDQSVAITIDGVQSSRGVFLDIGLLDIAQLEILKGPQALFFGKNSPGGVMSLTSQGPTSKWEGLVRAGYATGIGEKNVEGAIGGPLTESLGVRIAARYTDTAGWIMNDARAAANLLYPAPGTTPTLAGAPYDKNQSTSFAGRVTLEWKPSEDFTTTLRGAVARNRDNGQAAGTEQICPGETSDALGAPDPFGDCRIDNHQSVGAAPALTIPDFVAFSGNARGKPFGRLNAYVTSLTLDYRKNDFDITAVTGYLAYDWTRVLATPTIYTYANLLAAEKFHQFSQEVRLTSRFDGPLNLSVGAYYESNALRQNTPIATFPLPADPVTGSYLSYVYNAKLGGKSYSVFGQVRWKLLDQLELDAGARYTHDTRTNALVNSFVNAYASALFEQQGRTHAGNRKYDNVSPEVSLNWTPMANMLVYGSFRSGYKAGNGASPNTIGPAFNDEAALFYGVEKIKGFEAGLKALVLDHKLRFTAAAFSYKYTNLQVSNYDAAQNSVQPLGGDLTTKGFEAAVTFRAAEGLNLNAGIGYARARWTNFRGVACYLGQTALEGCVGGFQDLTGQRKFRSPDWSGSAGFNYESEIGGGLIAGINGKGHFVSSYFSQENNSRFAVQKGYAIFDAGIYLQTDDRKYELSILAKNIGQKRYVAYSLDTPLAVQAGTIEASVNRPRQFLLQLTARY